MASRGWFRSIDLWVMGPARSHCATLLPGNLALTFELNTYPSLLYNTTRYPSTSLANTWPIQNLELVTSIHLRYLNHHYTYITLQPLLLGKARVPFRQWLMAQSSSRVEVDVMSSAIDRRGTDIKETETEDGTERTLGKLTVRISR